METATIIKLLATFGEQLITPNDELIAVLHKTEIHNPWFTQNESRHMLASIQQKMLNVTALESWLQQISLPKESKTIGLVFAGNVPFVGMHDLICVLASGHFAKIKLSSKDMFFFPWMKQALVKLDSYFENAIQFVDKLENFDAVIATGSNNSARYFEYYFGKYPHIIRKNRTSVAIINGNETPEQLHALGKDVFYYYGLGCRNVGKVFIPENYDLQQLFKYWEDYRYVLENTKYSNNFDYNRALLMLNNSKYLTNDFYMLVESDQLFSPLSVLFQETYTSDADLQLKLEAIAENLQCVVANTPGNTNFGETQFPGLTDYADHVNTMDFLRNI